jgi:hypothetical protein
MNNKTKKIIAIIFVLVTFIGGFIFYRLNKLENDAIQEVAQGCKLWTEFVNQDITSNSYEHDSFGVLLDAGVLFQTAALFGDSNKADARNGIAKLVGEINTLTFDYTLKKSVNLTSDLDATYDEIVGYSLIVQEWCSAQ